MDSIKTLISRMNFFRNIIRLSVGDFLAKTLNFFAFVYLARILGVANYGVLEFAISILTYFLLLADGGLELWATREVARGVDIRELTGRVIPLRLLLALASFGGLLALLPFLQGYAGLRTVIILYGLTLFPQVVSLKWVFMGQEKMTRVAGGLVLAQCAFVVPVFFLVRSPQGIIWVPLMRLAGELAMAIYFLWNFAGAHGGLPSRFTLRGARQVLLPALTLGTSQGLGLMSFNLDSVLLGAFVGTMAVGYYAVAYKPVTMALAMPITYFLGLFPALSRTYAESREEFREMLARSLRLTMIFAMPLGVGGIFLASPIINLLFGAAYANSVPVLQILSWSAAFVIMRGTYRQALNAAHRSRLDLLCAGSSVGLNLILNLLLIPIYGIVGAAIATVVSEALWLTMAAYHSHRHIAQVNLLPLLLPPLAASIVMGICFLLSQSLFWVVQASLSIASYFCVLLLLSKTEVRIWLTARKTQPVVSHIGGRTT